MRDLRQKKKKPNYFSDITKLLLIQKLSKSGNEKMELLNWSFSAASDYDAIYCCPRTFNSSVTSIRCSDVFFLLKLIMNHYLTNLNLVVMF